MEKGSMGKQQEINKIKLINVIPERLNSLYGVSGYQHRDYYLLKECETSSVRKMTEE